jgi:uncharacterized protein YjbI with pentapeptide repeats
MSPEASSGLVTTSDQTLTRRLLQERLAEAASPHRFERCVFDGEDLGGLDLQGATFSACTFVGTRLDKASLGQTQWHRCRCAAATFDLADLADARFDHCDLNNTGWCRAKLSSASFTEVKLTGARFTEARTLGLAYHASLLVGADLRGISFRKQRLEALNFSGADLSGCDFTDAVLVDCDLTDANLKNARFARADLRRAQLGVLQVGDLVQHFKGSTISADQAAAIVAALGVHVV